MNLKLEVENFHFKFESKKIKIKKIANNNVYHLKKKKKKRVLA